MPSPPRPPTPPRKREERPPKCERRPSPHALESRSTGPVLRASRLVAGASPALLVAQEPKSDTHSGVVYAPGDGWSGWAWLPGRTGRWQIARVDAVLGDPLLVAERLTVLEGGEAPRPLEPSWVLRGVTSNERYLNRNERRALSARQEPLGRPEATCAALIPITKSEAWWALTQDERREIFEERSRHIATGLEYLPGVARRLHHGRDLGEPFDFLTWFEYAPANAQAFEQLVGRLRETEEWTYVEREVDIRLVRGG